MNWKEVAQSISALAPTIGAAIGGPYGTVAGMGVQALAKAFGIDPKAVDVKTQVKLAVNNMTPDQAMAVKAADQQFQKDMAKLEVDVFKLEVADKDSARKMQAQTKSNVPAILTFAFAGLAGYLVYAVFNSTLDSVDKTLVGTVIGYVFSELKQATSFWMGSSKGSHDKTIMMGNK